MSTELLIPYLSVGKLGWDLMRLDAEDYDRRRNELVDRVYANHEVDTELCPPAWRVNGPLQRWCWLILHLNDLEHDAEQPAPLIHWGIDFGFAGEDLRSFIWAIS